MKKLFLVLLLSFPCHAADYNDAFSTASQAALIQSGVQDDLIRYGKNAQEYFGIKRQTAVIGVLYHIIKTRKLEIFVSQTTTIFVQDYAAGIQYRF